MTAAEIAEREQKEKEANAAGGVSASTATTTNSNTNTNNNPTTTTNNDATVSPGSQSQTDTLGETATGENSVALKKGISESSSINTTNYNSTNEPGITPLQKGAGADAADSIANSNHSNEKENFHGSHSDLRNSGDNDGSSPSIEPELNDSTVHTNTSSSTFPSSLSSDKSGAGLATGSSDSAKSSGAVHSSLSKSNDNNIEDDGLSFMNGINVEIDGDGLGVVVGGESESHFGYIKNEDDGDANATAFYA